MPDAARHAQLGVRTYTGLVAVGGIAWVVQSRISGGAVDLSPFLFPLGRSLWGVGASLLVGLGFAWWGALFPDVDIKSRGQVLFYRAFFLVEVALLGLYYWRGVMLFLEIAAWGGLLSALPLIGKHRGWTHTRWAMLLVPAPILGLPALWSGGWVPQAVPFYLAAVLGYGSHLYADGMLFRRG